MKNEHLSFLFYCFYCLIFPSICPHINYMATASNGVEYPFFHPTVQLIQRFVLQESRQLRIFLASYIGRSSRNFSNLRRRSSTGISAECANPDFAFSTNPRTFFRKEDEGRKFTLSNRWTAHVSLWHPLPDVLSTWLKNIRGRPIERDNH